MSCPTVPHSGKLSPCSSAGEHHGGHCMLTFQTGEISSLMRTHCLCCMHQRSLARQFFTWGVVRTRVLQQSVGYIRSTVGTEA